MWPFKRKIALPDLVSFFSRTVVMVAQGDPSIQPSITQLLDAGANPYRVPFELCALSAFATLTSAAAAFQQNKMSEEAFGLFQEKFWEQIEQEIGGTSTDLKCVAETTLPLVPFMRRRVESYAAIGQGSAAFTIAFSDQLCAWVGVRESSTACSLMIQVSYMNFCRTAFKFIGSAKIVS
ncbi:MAG: hypothetical protein ABSG84_09340 [Acidobacteriaceae bacterium]|jgi:hypothetical protein